MMLRQPIQIKRNFHIYKRGLGYEILSNTFSDDGKLKVKAIYRTWFKYKVRQYLISQLHEEALAGVRCREIEVYNFTPLRFNLSGVRIHNI